MKKTKFLAILLVITIFMAILPAMTYAEEGALKGFYPVASGTPFITTDLVAEVNGNAITYSASTEDGTPVDYVSADGKVTLPLDYTPITLVATLENGDSKEYDMVLAPNGAQTYINDGFENATIADLTEDSVNTNNGWYVTKNGSTAITSAPKVKKYGTNQLQMTQQSSQKWSAGHAKKTLNGSFDGVNVVDGSKVYYFTFKVSIDNASNYRVSVKPFLEELAVSSNNNRYKFLGEASGLMENPATKLATNNTPYTYEMVLDGQNYTMKRNGSVVGYTTTPTIPSTYNFSNEIDIFINNTSNYVSFYIDDIFMQSMDKKAIAQNALSSITLPETANGDIVLPSTIKGAFGKDVAVTWTSSDTDVIANDGKFTQPNQAKTVTLTATGTVDGTYVSETPVEFEIDVDGKLDAYQTHLDNLVLGIDGTNYVSEDLPASITIDENVYPITYSESTNEEVVNNFGKVTKTTQYVDATITASITVEGTECSSSKAITVIPMNRKVIFSDCFEKEAMSETIFASPTYVNEEDRAKAISDFLVSDHIWYTTLNSADLQTGISEGVIVKTVNVENRGNVLNFIRPNNKQSKIVDATHKLDKTIVGGKAELSFMINPGSNYYAIIIDNIAKLRANALRTAGGSSNAISEIGILGNKWYRCSITMDLDLKTAELFVDGVSKGTFALDNLQSLDHIGIKGDRTYGATQNVYIDDVILSRVYDGSSYVEDVEISGNTIETVILNKAVANGKIYISAWKDGTMLEALSVGMDKIATPRFVIPKKADSVKYYLWDSSLTALADVKSDTMQKAAPKIYLLGDSTVAEYDDTQYPRAGWGMFIQNYLDGATVVNESRGGATTTSHVLDKTSGRFNNVIQNLQPGDYVIVQLGINDANNNMTKEDYQANLEYYVDKISATGAYPILVTPQIRCENNENATLQENDNYAAKDFDDVLATVASSKNVSVIDLRALSLNAYNQLSDNEKGTWTMVRAKYTTRDDLDQTKWANSVYNPESANYDSTANGTDGLHLNVFGADTMAELIANAIKDMDIYLSDFVR